MNVGLFGTPGAGFGYTKTSPIPMSIQQFFTSRTWIAPGDGYVEFIVMGAGGSGGLSIQANVDTRAQGGAGGGTSWARRKVSQGDTFQITLGAGGASVSIGSVIAANGNAGGLTSVLGPNLSIFIPGGLGGLAAANNATAIPSQARSIPVGGDINIPGGVAGGITGALVTCGSATGGAGIALGFVNPDSGSITVVDGAGQASGGASVWPSGNITVASTATGGGGTGGPSPINSATPGVGLVDGLGGSTTKNFAWGTIGLLAQGTSGVTSGLSGGSVLWGVASGGTVYSSGSGNGGEAAFAGSGGIACNTTSQNFASGAVTYVGGSGGCAVTDATSGSNWSSGKGGQGVAFVAFFPGV